MIYGERTNGHLHGTVYTKREIVHFILDLCLEDSFGLAGKVIIEPSAGDGAFVVPIIERILTECSNDLAALKMALSNVYVYELDSNVVSILLANIKNSLPEPSLADLINIQVGDFLLKDIPRADIVIGNPPYVRYDNIPLEQKEMYKSLYVSFSARADIYVAFIEKSIRALKPSGRVGFICADRWINNQYGRTLRGLISHDFHLKYFVKFSGYNPFQEEVIAYPSVFLIENAGSNPNICFSEVKSEEDLTLTQIEKSSKHYRFSENSEIEYDDLKDHFLSLEDQGFKIGIGVATGADRVFITDNKAVVEPELLMPIVSRRDFAGNGIAWRGFYLVNTYAIDGDGLVDLARFPLLQKYLNDHASQIMGRHVAKRNPNGWYKLIDPVHRDLQKKPKLLIPDITTKRSIIFDEGNYYPHHNLYYVTCEDIEKLLVLRSLLVSRFCNSQVAQKGVLMNGGALRWQAQTLRKLYIPEIDQISKKMKRDLIAHYDSNDFDRIDELVTEITARLSPTEKSIESNLDRSSRPIST